MATIQQTLESILTLDGAQCAALVDSSSGMMLGNAGSGLDMDVAAAGNTEVVRAKLKTMRALGLKDAIEDILITLETAHHISRPIPSSECIFVYAVLDKSISNLAMARRKLSEAERNLAF